MEIEVSFPFPDYLTLQRRLTWEEALAIVSWTPVFVLFQLTKEQQQQFQSA